jgi:hypothetical protein
MTVTTRERNIRRILWGFALICFLLAVYFFPESQRLEQLLTALTAESQTVQYNLQPVKKQLRKTKLLMWSSLGASILLAGSALAVGRGKGPPET